MEDVPADEAADAVEDVAAAALETVGAAAEEEDVVEDVVAAALERVSVVAAEVVEAVLAALLTGAVGASFLAQAAAKHTTPAMTAIRINDEDLVDMVLILPCFDVREKGASVTPKVESVKLLRILDVM